MGNCELCKYSDFSDKSKKEGFCKRYPPTTHVFPAQDHFTGQMQMQVIATQPTIRKDQQCGEYAEVPVLTLIQ